MLRGIRTIFDLPSGVAVDAFRSLQSLSLGDASRIAHIESQPSSCTIRNRLQTCLSSASRSQDQPLASTSGSSSAYAHQIGHQQWRGYKSNKRPLKPMNTAASWQAAEPLLPAAARVAAPRRELDSTQLPRAGPAIVDTCLPDVPEVPRHEPYHRVGVITGPFSLELQKVFAVVEAGGTQFKVTPDDVVFVNYLHGTDVNDVLELPGVMLLGSRSQTIIGRPYVPGAAVLVVVEEHFKDGKVHVFKRQPRKRYRRYNAPRQYLTTVRVLSIRGIEPAPGDALDQPKLPIAWDAAESMPALGEGGAEAGSRGGQTPS